MPFRRTKNEVRRRQATLGVLAGLPPGRVLDAPCGDGALARELAARGWRTCAADIEPVRFDGVDGVRFTQLVPFTPIRRGVGRTLAHAFRRRRFATLKGAPASHHR